MIGRRQEGIPIAYGSRELFAARTQDEAQGLPDRARPLGSGDALLIPIMLDDEPPPVTRTTQAGSAPTSTTAPQPQVALCVATYTKATNKLDLRYFVARHGEKKVKGDLDPIHAVARAILARWPALGTEAQEILGRTIHIEAACSRIAAQDGQTTARLQLVLNAWAWIYDEPLQSNASWKVDSIDSPFFRATRDMVSIPRQSAEPS